MTRPRKQQISLSDTPYYHVVSRCVRRAFLCGSDPHTGKNFDHRRRWIEERIRLLSSLFTVDICAYAIMNNHLHLVIRLSPEQATDWSAREVIKRWRCLYKGPLIIDKYLSGEPLSPAEASTCSDLIALWKKRLSDLSWFMKCLNEPIARQANQEDSCTGHFWEGRFKSQPLLTEQALLSCMAYVDLNPVRAGIADKPETSDYTSIRERLNPTFDLESALRSFAEYGGNSEAFSGNKLIPAKPLLPFSASITEEHCNSIPLTWKDYLTLVDWTGRAVRKDKRGHIPDSLPGILDRLGLAATDWQKNSLHFERVYRGVRSGRQKSKTG